MPRNRTWAQFVAWVTNIQHCREVKDGFVNPDAGLLYRVRRTCREHGWPTLVEEHLLLDGQYVMQTVISVTD